MCQFALTRAHGQRAATGNDTLATPGNAAGSPSLGGRSRTVAYTYDKLNRLEDETITGSGGFQPPSVSASVSYVLDKVGNRTQRTSTLPGITTQTSTYTDNDRLTTDTYDNNGNTTNALVSALGSASGSAPVSGALLGVSPNSVFTDLYDFQNRLIQRLYQNGTKIELDYDAEGNRAGQKHSYRIEPRK